MKQNKKIYHALIIKKFNKIIQTHKTYAIIRRKESGVIADT